MTASEAVDSADSADSGRKRTKERPKSPLKLIDAVAGDHRRSLAAIAFAALIGAFAEAAVFLLLAKLAFAIAQGDSRVKAGLGPLGELDTSIPTLVAIAAALTVFRCGAQILQARLTTRTFAAVWSGVRARLVSAYAGASWAVQSTERDGRLQELATTYATMASNSVLGVSYLIVASLSLVAFLATAFAVNAVAALAVVAAAVLVASVLLPIRRTVRKRWRISGDANLVVATDISEFAANMQEVRVFGVEAPMLRDMTGRINSAGKLQESAQFIRELAPALYQGMALLLMVGAVGLVYEAGVSQLSELGGIVLVMVRSVSYGQQLQTNYQSLHAAAPFLETLVDEEQRYVASSVRREGEPIPSIGAITFEHVSYEYEMGRPVLEDVSFDLRRGEIIGIVGPSGSGKSTLVQLLLRLRDPSEGHIYMEGREIASLDLDDWYQHVSFVPQDARFFAGTVADSIRFFRDDIDDAAIRRAAKLANLEDDIESWPLRYDTPVGERGGQLSGGQRQRLSIARALAKEPDVIVLDEPTSSLDVRSEALIRDTLRGLGADTTVVVIAHRLSTLNVCDRIMVVKDGRIQGFDAPDRLEATNPDYLGWLQLSGLR